MDPDKLIKKKEYRKGRWVWRFYLTDNQELTDFIEPE